MPVVDLPDNIVSLTAQHAVNGAQRQADGAAIHVEHLRTAFLLEQSNALATASRTISEAGAGRARDIAINPPTVKPA